MLKKKIKSLEKQFTDKVTSLKYSAADVAGIYDHLIETGITPNFKRDQDLLTNEQALELLRMDIFEDH